MTNKLSVWFLYFTAAASGAAVMAVEISASRLLAPFFGASLFVWTNIIGAVMIALALGYYMGGKLADRGFEIKLILRILFLAGLVFLILPDAVRAIAQAGTGRPADGLSFLLSASFGLSLLALCLPLWLLGMVTPFLTKVYSQKVLVGKAAGSISAFSTIGSVLGTYLPAVWLIPAFGTKATIQIFAGSLILLGLCGFWPVRRKFFAVVLLAAAFTIFGSSVKVFNQISQWGQVIFATESPYQYIRVAESEGTRYLLYNQGWASQSSFNPDKILTGGYYDYYNLLPYFFSQSKKTKVLVLGLAGGTILRQMDYFFPGKVDLTAVEIDSVSVSVAKDYFGLGESPAKIVIADGRRFIQQDSGFYDIVVTDVFFNEYEIPWHMTTREFWQEVSARLAPRGIVAMNVIGPSFKPGLQTALSNTLSGVFQTVYLTPLSQNRIGNFLLTACACDFTFSDLQPENIVKDLRPGLAYLTEQSQKIENDKNSNVLTDDRAPVELLTASMILGADNP